ncbi:MAG: 3-oxoacyl-(acyl-carrier-protein) reductase FabG [Syntrophorhabdaceae bacterium PtaU1.Bin034]|jgi:NAD(P)-dependent dehydrogenase (short-subunit alcohol dehydrogenase family)|nr:MAG: 3-oxoacyl-(acyl-carrier-protein) reductase FabG [Syntrophorhabdaceae bacterium PtaU1.Bin034]
MEPKRTGKIINMSSVCGIHGAPVVPAYSAAKAGIMGFTKAVAQEVIGSGIVVNAPILGVDPSQVVETIAKTSMPLGRPQQPEDIGEAVAYFCKADNASGQALVIDGGQTMW